MRKFLLLCLTFMVASVLNMKAADTYSLVGELNSWNVSDTSYDFTYDESTDSYSLSGVTLHGEFKIAKNHSWDITYGSNGNNVPLDAAYITWNDGAGNMTMIDGKAASYSNCKLTFKILGSKNASLHITSDTPMTTPVDTKVTDGWYLGGVIDGEDCWTNGKKMTDLGNGVYEYWVNTLPEEFKFKADNKWDVNYGIHSQINNTPIMGFDNALDGGGNNIKITSATAYDKYRILLTVRGWVASFRVDGYTEVKAETIFYESFNSCTGTNNSFSGGDGNGSFVTDNDGWTAEKKYGADGAAKFGTGSVKGIVTTPALGVNGDATLTFNAAPWASDGTTLELSISSGSLSVSSVTMTASQWNTFTVNITGATEDATITFTPTKRFFLDEVKVERGSAPDWAPVISGVENGATYYNNAKVEVKAPGADTFYVTHIEDDVVVVDANKYIAPNFYANGCLPGAVTISATAYKGYEYYSVSKEFTVEKIDIIYSLNEFINTTDKLQFKGTATVTYQNGQNLYLRDNAYNAILVYGSVPAYQPGDGLSSFVGEYELYNGTHEVIPVGSTFGAPDFNIGAPSPETMTIDQITVEGQNKYVKVENVILDSANKTIGGLSYYDKFKVTYPADETKAYTVVGIIGLYNNAPQLYPISFEEYKLPPFTYSSILPEDDAEVESLSEIVITFPYEVTYDATVAMGVMVMDGANIITPNVAVEGNVATLTFNAITAQGSKPSLMVMAGAFKEKVSGTGCSQFSASWAIAEPPVKYDYNPIAITPANGSEVESLEKILTEWPYEDGYNYLFAAMNPGIITTVDEEGNSYDTYVVDDADYTGQYNIYIENATAAGKYTITIPAATFFDDDYAYTMFDTNTSNDKGHASPEIVLTYTIVGSEAYDYIPVANPPSGSTLAQVPNKFTIEFEEAMEFNSASCNKQALIVHESPNGDIDDQLVYLSAPSGTGYGYTVTVDNNNRTQVGTHTITFPEGMFWNAAKTRLNPEFVITYTVGEVTYDESITLVSADPADGSNVAKLDKVKVSFNDFAGKCTAEGQYGHIIVRDDKGNVYENAYISGDWQGTLGKDYIIYMYTRTWDPIEAEGTYSVTIPAATILSNDETKSNPEITLTYTIGTAKTVGTYPTIDPASGSELSELKKFTMTFGYDYSNGVEINGSNGPSVKNANGEDVAATQLTFNGWYAIDVELNETITTPGTYTITFPEGMIFSYDDHSYISPEIVVTYTIAAGGDMAEFTVPAGYAGYINYDETAINAWGEEFPFTISTTANNNLQFAAELTTLPTGLTAFEVLNPEGEVIAALAQEGNRFTGTTTNEYADGATVKFRFRISHAGPVSETIEFAYVVGGGIITSVDSIDLENDVIVRGNNIYAPQGAAIYTVSGISVDGLNLEPGIYVVRYGNEIKKVAIN